jgi:hypothetical protein
MEVAEPVTATAPAGPVDPAILRRLEEAKRKLDETYRAAQATWNALTVAWKVARDSTAGVTAEMVAELSRLRAAIGDADNGVTEQLAELDRAIEALLRSARARGEG